jgi:hypothetical protein
VARSARAPEGAAWPHAHAWPAAGGARRGLLQRQARGSRPRRGRSARTSPAWALGEAHRRSLAALEGARRGPPRCSARLPPEHRRRRRPRRGRTPRGSARLRGPDAASSQAAATAWRPGERATLLPDAGAGWPWRVVLGDGNRGWELDAPWRRLEAAGKRPWWQRLQGAVRVGNPSRPNIK